MNKDDFTDCRLQCRDESLVIQVGDKGFSTEVRRISSGFPFFGLSSCHCSATTFDALKIEGAVTIPRQVDMLSESLLGWSTKFKGQRLPDLEFSAGSSSSRTSADDQSKAEWQFVDGDLESVVPRSPPDETAASAPRHEALIQYLRPLCDGEEVSLEFYYESGQFCLAPSIGRVAILLSQPQLHLHWITSDSGGHWTGIGSENKVIDPQAEQLKLIELKENDWNQVAVRLDGEIVTMRLNGEDVYRRRWEATVGREFGLYHDPTEYHVRARNVRLSGDWPETLPENLFETESQAE